MCAGDANKCSNKCMPEIVNVTNDDSLGCRQVNQCDEIYLEENEKINQCTSVCTTLENKHVKVNPVAFLLGLLLLVLMGTISLNFYRESVGCPLKCSRPWYREVPGRVLVYCSMSLTTVLVIWIISLLGGPSSALYDPSMGFAIAMAFVIIFIVNIGLIVTSLLGRCCIAQDTTVAEASSESDEADASSSTATVVVGGAAN